MQFHAIFFILSLNIPTVLVAFPSVGYLTMPFQYLDYVAKDGMTD